MVSAAAVPDQLGGVAGLLFVTIALRFSDAQLAGFSAFASIVNVCVRRSSQAPCLPP
jgi:hypothetical protein